MSKKSSRVSRRSFVKAGAALGATLAASVFSQTAFAADNTSSASGSTSASASGSASAFASAAGSASTTAPATFTPGTYISTVASIKGDMTVATSFDDVSITDIHVVSCVDTPVISDCAIDQLPARIIAAQNIDCDAVAGATFTSKAIESAVADCITQAGGDPAAFQKGSDAIASKAEGDDEDFDIVIVGAGMAGMSAAITAAKSDAAPTVLLLEKESYVGGCFRVCGGGMWTMGAPINEWVGQDCSLDDYTTFMQKRSQDVQINTDLLANIRDIAADTFMYLYTNGLTVNPLTWSLGNPEAQLPCFWSCNHSDNAWETGNSGWADNVKVIVDHLGVETRVNSRVTGLVADGTTVTGVTVEDSEKTYTVNAKKVIITTGGFTRNTDLIAEYAPDFANAFAFTSAGDTGDGITMTRDLDVPVVGKGMMGLYGINPMTGYYGKFGNLVWFPQISVNAEGEDFALTEAFYGDTLALMLQQTGSCAYGIYDSTNAAVDRLDEAVEAGIATKYDTLDALADDMGIAKDGLTSVAADKGISAAPFYCLVQKPLFIGSIPGLQVNENCQVENSAGDVIENLYAAGMVMFGNVFDVAYPCSGTGVGTSNYTGAIAATDAVAAL